VSIAQLARLSFDTMGLDGDLAICGGGSRSDRWTQLFADVLGCPVWRPEEPELGAIGAAYVAWDALGTPVDPEIRRARRRVFHPDAAKAEWSARSRDAFREDLESARRDWAR
jgi:sugar (pentulose or hexulose) kinase